LRCGKREARPQVFRSDLQFARPGGARLLGFPLNLYHLVSFIFDSDAPLFAAPSGCMPFRENN
jgi:hypothetical protein